MKKNITIQLLRAFTILLFLINSTSASAQSIWDGGGDGTSWDDPLNWNSDVVPSADSLVEFTMDATVTGTATEGAARITIKGMSEVVLDLDLTLGNGTIDDHAIVISPKSTLNFGTGTTRSFVLNPAANKNGLAVFGGSDSVMVHIATEATVQILQGTNGLNLANNTATFVNDGNIIIENGVKNGIKTSGDFMNNGSIIMSNPITDGIVVGAGTFQNGDGANIIITKPADDCIELIGESVFTNMGTLNLVAQDSAGSGNNALSVGTEMIAAEFINMASGEVIADGGDKDSGRALSVLEMGAFTNMGLTSLSGGGETSRFFNKGFAENGLNAILDLQDGRINNNTGTFTNNGLVKSTRDGSGIFNSGLAVNNAFFDYTNSNSFAGGANGTVEDNGISLNNNSRIINGGGSCDLDIAESTYEYFEGTTSIGITDATGALTLGNEVLTADSVNVTTSIPGVELIIKNVCAEAVMTTSVFGLDREVVALKIYPTLVGNGEQLNIDLSTLPAENMVLHIYNSNGQLLAEEMTYGAEEVSIGIDEFSAGLHFIKAEVAGKTIVGKFVKR